MEKQDKELIKTIGENLKNIRLHRNITQEDFADLVDLSRASVNNIEAGRQATTVLFLLKSCKILKCEIQDIVPLSFPVTLKSVNAEVRINKKIESLKLKIDKLKDLQKSI